MHLKELHFGTFPPTLIFNLAKYLNCLVTELAVLFLKFSVGDLAQPDQFAFTFPHCMSFNMSEASYERGTKSVKSSQFTNLPN